MILLSGKLFFSNDAIRLMRNYEENVCQDQLSSAHVINFIS